MWLAVAWRGRSSGYGALKRFDLVPHVLNSRYRCLNVRDVTSDLIGDLPRVLHQF
jgi:hypothetical protein